MSLPLIRTVLRRCPCPRRWQRCPNRTLFHLVSLILVTGRARWAGQSVSLGPFCLDGGCTRGEATPTFRADRSRCNRLSAAGPSELTLNRLQHAFHSPAEGIILLPSGSGVAVTRRSCCTSVVASSFPATAPSSSRTSPPSRFACTFSPPLRGSSTWTAGHWSQGWHRLHAIHSGAPPSRSRPSRWTHRGPSSCCPWCRSRNRCCWGRRFAVAAPCLMTCCDDWYLSDVMSVWVASWGCLPLYYHFVSNVWFSLITDWCSECCDSCGGLSSRLLSPPLQRRNHGITEKREWCHWNDFRVTVIAIIPDESWLVDSKTTRDSSDRDGFRW